MSKQSCLECRFWKKEKDTGLFHGTCRRYAPRCGAHGGWITTNIDDWCGDFDIADPDEITERKAIIEKEYPTKKHS